MPRALRITLTVLAAAATLYAIAVVWQQNERAAGLDFYIYFVAGQLAGRADIDNVYSDEVQSRVGEEYFARAQESTSELRRYDAQRRRRLDIVSSPFLLATMQWPSRDYDRALTQYHAFVLMLFIAGVLLLCRAAGVSWAASLFLLAALLLWYRGFEADLRVGNVNSIQLAALGLIVWSARGVERWPLHWLLLGALLLFKPNVMFVPLLLAVARLARRESRRLLVELMYGAAGAVGALVIGSIAYGSPRVWLQWVGAANAFYHRLPGRMERNVTPALSLFQQHGEWVSYVLIALLLGLVCAAILESKTNDAPLLVGMGVLIYLLSANVVWLHYMVLVIPIAVALMRWRSTTFVAVMALLVIAEEPFEILLDRPAFPVEGTILTCAMLGLFVCGLARIRRSVSDVHPRAAVV